MSAHNEVAEKIESQEVMSNEDAVVEALQIEEVLHRAYEIRRARGGLFGYNLEDWLEAEREVTLRHRATRLQIMEVARAKSLREDRERISCQCAGTNR
jgi:Protein of unknown function (DUF2934)